MTCNNVFADDLIVDLAANVIAFILVYVSEEYSIYIMAPDFLSASSTNLLSLMTVKTAFNKIDTGQQFNIHFLNTFSFLDVDLD